MATEHLQSATGAECTTATVLHSLILGTAAVLIGLLLFPAQVPGAVYKCTDAHGRTTFSDVSCAPDATILNQYQSHSTKPEPKNPNPASSITLANGSVQLFKKILSIEVKTKTGYKTGRKGLHIFHNGTDHLLDFEKLVSLKVLNYDRKYCGNYAHLCKPKVSIKTKKKEISAHYEALLNVKILIDDDLGGGERELTIWFGNKNKAHIRAIRF